MSAPILKYHAAKIKRTAWLLAYRLEELRQHYANRQQHFKRIAATLALIVLRLGGAR